MPETYAIPNTAFEEDGVILKKGEDIPSQNLGKMFVWPPRATNDPLTPYGADEALLEIINRDSVHELTIELIDHSNEWTIGQSPFTYYREVASALPQGNFTVSLRDRVLATVQNTPNSRSDISCAVETLKGALELLWSEKEGRNVVISASYIRWAYDKYMGSFVNHNKRSGTDPQKVILAIQTYGACEEKFMSPRETTPSAAAIADAANRKSLVARKVSYFKRSDPTSSDTSTSFLWSLIAHELTLGRPIFVAGKIPTISKKSSKELDGAFAHTNLWIGISQKTGNWPRHPTLEVLELQGKEVGDQGIFQMSSRTIYKLGSQDVKAWSLSLN